LLSCLFKYLRAMARRRGRNNENSRQAGVIKFTPSARSRLVVTSATTAAGLLAWTAATRFQQAHQPSKQGAVALSSGSDVGLHGDQPLDTTFVGWTRIACSARKRWHIDIANVHRSPHSCAIVSAAAASSELPVSDVMFYGSVVVIFSLGLAIGLLVKATNPPNDTPPRGDMPRLAAWLAVQAPPQPKRATSSKACTEKLKLEPATSMWDLWQLFSFTSTRIIEEVPSMMFEKNFWLSFALQVSAFPRTYWDWEKYEACSVEEILLGPEKTVVGPIPDAVVSWSANVPRAVANEWSTQRERRDERERIENERERQVVEECGRMVSNYGLAVIAREPRDDGQNGAILAGATVRVKRLPQGCHIDEECYIDEESLRADSTSSAGAQTRPAVICTVNLAAVSRSSALEAVAYMDTLAVAREQCGKGIAGQLLTFAEDKARLWGLRLLALHVHRDNWSALQFYERRGFEVTSDWMGWGSTYFLLLKPLDPL